IDHLLQADQVLRMLDDRPPHPGKSVGIFLVPAGLEPPFGDQLKGVSAIKIEGAAIIGDQGSRLAVDHPAHHAVAALSAAKTRSSPASTLVGACHPSSRATFVMSATSVAGSATSVGLAPQRNNPSAPIRRARCSTASRTLVPRPVAMLNAPSMSAASSRT